MTKVWTYEKCKEIAARYNTVYELKRDYPQVCRAIYREHWTDECLSHITRHNNTKRGIYAFEFEDNHAYVGLTYDFERRKQQHLGVEHVCKSKVTKHIEKTGLTPIFKILHDYVSAEEAKELEAYYLDEYRKNGWAILNAQRAGGLGGNENIVYDFDETVEIAKQFKSRTEFAEAHRNLYSYFGDRKRLEELFEKAGLPNQKNKVRRWTRENIIADAKQYNQYIDWIRERKHTSYNAARKMNILEEIKKLYD